MGRTPCCDRAAVKRGPWSPEEDEALRSYVQRHGSGGNWIAMPKKAGERYGASSPFLLLSQLLAACTLPCMCHTTMHALTRGRCRPVALHAGLKRCGKSCRLRWLNYLRPDIRHGGFTAEEDAVIMSLYTQLGSK